MSTMLSQGHTDPFGLSDQFSQLTANSPYGHVLQMLGQPSPTKMQQLVAAHQALPVDLQTIWGAYQGTNVYLTEQITQRMFDYNTPLFKVCPLVLTDNLGERVVRKIRFPTTMLMPSAPLSITRTVSWQISEHNYMMAGHSLGFECEKKWLSTPQAPMIFERSMACIRSSTAFTAEMSIVEGLLNCKNLFVQLNAFQQQHYINGLNDLLEKFNNTVLAIHKSYMGFAIVMEFINSSRQMLGARPASLLFVPPGTFAQLAFGDDYPTTAFKSGGDALARLEQGTDRVRSWRGVTLQEGERVKYDYSGNAPAWSPWEHWITLGLFGTSDLVHLQTWDDSVPYNTNALHSPSLFTIGEGCRMVEYGIEHIIRADQYLNPTTGHLRTDLLQTLVRSYESLVSDMQLNVRMSKMGHPLVDPHIAFDDEHRGYVISRFCEMDPDYFSNDTMYRAAQINNATVRSRIGPDRMRQIERMLELLSDARNQTLSEDDTIASPVEAFTLAVVSYWRNRTAVVPPTGLTPGNSLGADHLPPLFVDPVSGRRYVGTQLTPGGPIVPVYFVTNRTYQTENYETASFYSVGGVGGAAVADPFAVFARTMTNGFSEELVPAPDMPAGYSSGPHANTIAQIMSTADPNANTWFEGNDGPTTRAKFADIAAGWNAFTRYYWPLVSSVFSPNSKRDPLTQNLLMDELGAPFYVRPQRTTDSTMLQQYALFQQAFVGYNGPLAIGNVYPTEGTAAVSIGLAAARARAGDRIAVPELNVAIGGPNPTRRPRVPENTNHLPHNVGNAVTILVDRHNDNAGELALRVPLLVLMQQATLSPQLKSSLEAGGDEFVERLQRAIANAGVSGPFHTVRGANGAVIAEPTALERFMGVSLPQLNNRSLMQLLSDGNNRTNIGIAISFFNSIWNVLSVSGVDPQLTARGLTRAGQVALRDGPTLSGEVVAAATDERRAGARRARDVQSGLEEYSREIGLERPDRYSSPRYVVSRLQVSGSMFDNVSSERAYVSTLRFTSIEDPTVRVNSPYQNMGEQINVGGLAGLLSNDALDVDVLRAAIYGAGPGTRSTVPAAMTSNSARNVRSKARSEMTDAGPTDVSHGLGPVGMYTHGGALMGMESDISSGGSAAAATGSVLGTRSQSQRQHGGASAMAFSSYGGSDTYYDESSYDIRGRITGDSDPYNPIADIALYEPLLLLTESLWTQARVAWIGEHMANVMERAMALIMITSVICRPVLDAMRQANFVLLRSYVLFTPFIDILAGIMVATVPGIGQMLYAKPDISMGFSAQTLKLDVRFSVELGCIIEQDDQVTVLPAFKINSYGGGGSCKLVGAGTCFSDVAEHIFPPDQQQFNYSRMGDKKADVFVFATGVDYQLGTEVPLSGRFNPSAFAGNWTADAQRAMSYQAYPSALYANLCCGFNRVGDQSRRPHEDRGWNDLLSTASDSTLGVLCFRTRQCHYNPKTGAWDHVRYEGYGPLGRILPGCSAVFAGNPGMINGSTELHYSSNSLPQRGTMLA